METSIRKNYRNTQQAQDMVQGEPEPELEIRQDGRLPWHQKAIDIIPRWVSFKDKRKAVVAVLLLIIAGVGYGVYEKFFNLSSEELAARQLAAAITAIEKHMILPEGDEPVLATVTDAEALKAQQPFFNGAVNGDQLLLFPRSIKAVIYSPSRDRIVNVGPIQQPAPVETTGLPANSVSNRVNPAVSTPITIEVRNGSGKGGLAAQLAENLRAAGFDVIAIADAKDKSYPKTVLSVRTNNGVKSELVSSLAAQMGAELIADIPEGEKGTSADVLIILGNGE